MIKTHGPALAPGFTRYASLSQKMFRAALDCLSRPCRSLKCLPEPAPGPWPITGVAGSLALTLLDSATSVWLSPGWRRAADWLGFHRGCPICDSPEKAAFVLAASPAELPPLAALNQGTDRYPDTSATVILGSVLPLDDRRPLLAKGPGIDGALIFSGHGLGDDFIEQWSVNRASYPLGIDVFLAGEDVLAGLPRSVSLEECSEVQSKCM